jgi:hypothetical protein
MGMRSPGGWSSYFPVAVLLKSTWPELLLVLSAAACLVVSTVRGRRFDIRSSDPIRGMLLLFAVALVLSLLRSRINIGHRYTLPLYPVAVLASTDFLAEALSGRRQRLRIALVVLLGAQVVTSLATAPRYLSYFNSLAGGPEHGWRYLVDSNIDWGQDLPALRRVIAREGYRRVACDYFGTASLEGYGIRAETVGWLSRPLDEYDALAVSVTQLQSVYPRGGESAWQIADCYQALRRLRPAHRAGDSIFVYDLRSPGVREAFVRAATSVAVRLKPPESPVQTATRGSGAQPTATR